MSAAAASSVMTQFRPAWRRCGLHARGGRPSLTVRVVALLLSGAPLPAAVGATEPATAGPADALAAWRYDPAGKRDPFRPVWLATREAESRALPLSPLQGYELSQLKLTGVVLDLDPPRALVEDASGLGFILVPGTPIGTSEGRVTRIGPRQVVVEEWRTDVIGQRHRVEVVLELPADEEVEP